ncbi:Calmodulin-binding protein 60 E [Camellia lanceoleosa]|uniref:Calmodulin-binding protein 60 E n=1 Tax=Camellia lanceoleosa TaxID=1840588 RepID=A0ACC0HXH0_9ERIC|nr:Calmodulin-binding protein 60 E [Camellia lanceoleosa]
MESSRGRRVEKRVYEESLEDQDDGMPHLKKPKLPGLASVIVEALKVDSLQRLCSSLEPLFRRIVSEEVERALTKLGHAQLAARSSPPRIQGPEGKNLQLHFKTRMPHHLFTGGKVEGEQGAAVHVVLLDASTGNVVQTGPESAAKLNVVVLEGDFNEEADDNWTKEHFESHEVKEREGKRPLLTGDLQLSLKEGVGTLGDIIFTDNSSWIRSRKFRLGVKVALGNCDGISADSLVKRAYENWNQVVEYDGEVLNSLSIGKNETRAAASTISEHNHVTTTQNKQQCISFQPSPQCQTKNNLSNSQLIEFPFIRSDSVVGMAITTPQAELAGTADYGSVGMSAFGGSYLPRLLKTFNMGIGSTFGHSDEACFSYNAPYEHQLGQTYGQERGRTSGKAVVVWLKVKAALRWGIFIRKKAAERRAQLVELD